MKKLHLVILDLYIGKENKNRHTNILKYFTDQEDINHYNWNAPYEWSSSDLAITSFKNYEDSKNINKYYNEECNWIYLLHSSQDEDINKFLNENKCYNNTSHELMNNVAICFHSGEPPVLPNDSTVFAEIAKCPANSLSIASIELMSDLDDIKKKFNIDAMLTYCSDTDTPSSREALHHLLRSHPEQAAVRITERINRRLFKNYGDANGLEDVLEEIGDDKFKKDIEIVKKATEDKESNRYSELEEILNKIKAGQMDIPALSNEINNWLIDNFSRP